MRSLAPGSTIVVMPYNPLAWTINRYITVPVFRNDIQVVDASTGKLVPFEIFQSPPIYDHCDFHGICGYPNVSCN